MGAATHNSGLMSNIWGRQFRCNSVYDPDTAVTGASNVSASLYTFMASYYKRSQVIWSKAKFTLRQEATWSIAAAADQLYQFTCKIDDDGANLLPAPGEIRQLDKPGTQSSCVFQCVAYGGKREVKSHTLFWHKDKFVDKEAQNGLVVDNGSLVTSADGTYFFHPLLGSLKGGLSDDQVGPTLNLQVSITYKVKWSDLKDIELETAMIPNQM